MRTLHVLCCFYVFVLFYVGFPVKRKFDTWSEWLEDHDEDDELGHIEDVSLALALCGYAKPSSMIRRLEANEEREREVMAAKGISESDVEYLLLCLQQEA